MAHGCFDIPFDPIFLLIQLAAVVWDNDCMAMGPVNRLWVVASIPK
jgi:hypothetical protein